MIPQNMQSMSSNMQNNVSSPRVYVSNCINNQPQFSAVPLAPVPVENNGNANITMKNGVQYFFPQTQQPIPVPAQIIPQNQSYIIIPRCYQPTQPNMYPVPMQNIPGQIIMAQVPENPNQYIPYDAVYECTKGMSRVREYFNATHESLVSQGKIPPDFDPQEYLRANPDLVKFCMQSNSQYIDNKKWLTEFAYKHYTSKGKLENRPIKLPTQQYNIPIPINNNIPCDYSNPNSYINNGSMNIDNSSMREIPRQPLYTTPVVLAIPQNTTPTQQMYIQAPVAPAPYLVAINNENDNNENDMMNANNNLYPNRQSGVGGEKGYSAMVSCSSITQNIEAKPIQNNNECNYDNHENKKKKLRKAKTTDKDISNPYYYNKEEECTVM